MNTEEFIKRAISAHGDKYDYSEVRYVNFSAKVKIICRTHGAFLQAAGTHIGRQKCGCPVCASALQGKNKRLTTPEFIAKAVEVHGNKYDYSLAEYKTSKDKVRIICPTHGEFLQSPRAHTSNGSGCPVCGLESRAAKRTSTLQEFSSKAEEIHKEKYTYSKVDYISARKKVIITCPVHGEFLQTPDAHIGLKKAGYPACSNNVSRGEEELCAFLDQYFPIQRNSRDIIPPMEIDIFLREKKIGIEYNGSYFHSEKFRPHPRNSLNNKRLACEKAGIRLIHISDTDKKEVVTHTLSHILGVTKESVFARKCKVSKINSTEAAAFLSKFHLQGAAPGNNQALALTFEEETVAVMVMGPVTSERGRTASGRWELKRYASKIRVVGGMSRLFSNFVRAFSGIKEVVSYSDNNWFTGDAYNKIGFRLIHETKPDYKYTDGSTVKHKAHFKLSNIRKIDPENTLSEREWCWKNGWYRLWDCGKKKWEWKRPCQ